MCASYGGTRFRALLNGVLLLCFASGDRGSAECRLRVQSGDWEGVLDLDVISFSDASKIDTMSSAVSKETIQWVAPVVVSEWATNQPKLETRNQKSCSSRTFRSLGQRDHRTKNDQQQLLVEMVLREQEGQKSTAPRATHATAHMHAHWIHSTENLFQVESHSQHKLGPRHVKIRSSRIRLPPAHNISAS